MHTKEEIIASVGRSVSSKDFSQQAVATINRCAEKVLARLQQDNAASLKENAEAVALQLGKNLAQKLSAISQNWVDNSKLELMIYPEGTRFIQKDGLTTVIVIEQPPQIRTIFYERKKYHISIPYSVFVLRFQDRNWNNLSVGFRITPLMSLNDHLFATGLPNLHGAVHGVCMGEYKPDFSKNKTQQAAAVISEFWQSQFNSGDFQATLEQWELKTKTDPLYGLKRQYNKGERIIDVVSGYVNSAENIDLVSHLKQEIIKAVTDIGSNVRETILNINLVKENKQKVSIETLEEILKEIIKQAYKELWDYLEVNLQKERLAMQREAASLLERNRETNRSEWH